MIRASQIFARNVLGHNPGTSLLNSVNSADILEEKIDTSDGQLCCWHNLDSDAVDLQKPVIVIFYAQTHLMSSPTTLSRINYFIERNYRVVCYDRRNSGASSKGNPMLFMDDAQCIMDYIINTKKCSPEEIACLGWCAGTGIAANMAKHYKTGALILELVYTKMKDRFYLTKNLDDMGLNCDENVEAYCQACVAEGRTAKIFIMNGQRDYVTPFNMTIKLLRRFNNAKGRVVIVPEGGHNDIPFRLYANEIEDFLLNEQKQTIRTITKRKKLLTTHGNTILSGLYTGIFSTKLESEKDLKEIASDQARKAIETLDHLRLDLLESLWDFSILPLEVSADKEFKVVWKAFRLTTLISSIKSGTRVLPILSNLYGNGAQFLFNKSGIGTEKSLILKENLDVIADYYISVSPLNVADIPSDFENAVRDLKSLDQYTTNPHFRRNLDVQVTYLCQNQKENHDLKNQLLFLMCRFCDGDESVNKLIQKLGGDIVKKSYRFENLLIAIQSLSIKLISEDNFLQGHDLDRLVSLFKDIAPSTVYTRSTFSRALQCLMFIDIPVFQYLFLEDTVRNLLMGLMKEALNIHSVLWNISDAHTSGISLCLSAVEQSKKINNERKKEIQARIGLCCAYFDTLDLTEKQKEVYVYLRISELLNEVEKSDVLLKEAIDSLALMDEISQWPILCKNLKNISLNLHQLASLNEAGSEAVRGFIDSLYITYHDVETDIIQSLTRASEVRTDENPAGKNNLIDLLVDIKRYIRALPVKNARASQSLNNNLNGLLDDAIVSISKIEFAMHRHGLPMDIQELLAKLHESGFILDTKKQS